MAEYLCTRFLSAVLREFELVPVHDVAVSFLGHGLGDALLRAGAARPAAGPHRA